MICFTTTTYTAQAAQPDNDVQVTQKAVQGDDSKAELIECIRSLITIAAISVVIINYAYCSYYPKECKSPGGNYSVATNHDYSLILVGLMALLGIVT